MSTTTTTQAFSADGIKEFAVTVRSQAATKFEFLVALAKKVAETTMRLASNIWSVLRDAWMRVPASASGSTAALITSTRAGYETVLNTVWTGARAAWGILTKVGSWLHEGIDRLGAFIANLVCRIHKPTGERMHDVNCAFTEMRDSAIEWMRHNTKGIATVLRNAYRNKWAVRAATAASVLITVGMALNTFAAGFASLWALTVPVVGRGLVYALKGGSKSIAAIVVAATIGASVGMVFDRDAILADVREDSTTVVAEATTTYVNDGATTFVVTGVDTAEQAEQVVEEHLATAVAGLEQSLNVRPAPRPQAKTYPARSGKPNGQQRKPQSKNRSKGR